MAKRVKSDPRVSHQRFNTADVGGTITVPKLPRGFKKKKVTKTRKDGAKYCEDCKQYYFYSTRVIWNFAVKPATRRCVHDSGSGASESSDMKRARSALKPGETAIQGGDGIVRIYDQG